MVREESSLEWKAGEKMMISDVLPYGRRKIDMPDTRTLSDRLARYAAKRDTVLMEAALGVNGVANAILTVNTDGEGNPVAPFLMSSMQWLSFNQLTWTLCLAIYALVTLVSLVHGQATGNAFFVRAAVHIFGTIFQALIAVAIFTGPLVPVAGMRYALTAFWSFCVACILITKHDIRMKTLAADKGKNGVL